MNKPTPLERIISDWHWAAEDVRSGAISVKDSLILAAAREELRVMRELCEALTDERSADQAWEIVGRIQDAEKAYRTWLAKQEGGR